MIITEKLQFLIFSYAGLIRIRFTGRNAQFPLSLFESSPNIQFQMILSQENKKVNTVIILCFLLFYVTLKLSLDDLTNTLEFCEVI